MPGDVSGGPSSETAHKKRQSGRILDWIDVIAKVLIPIVLAIFTAITGYMVSSIQSKISAATLLSEREKAESQLRASMFSSLIGPIVGSQNGGNVPADRERLLVELLALNFHEHFEVKPLFERVDQRLARKQDKAARGSLRSVARRIIDRQIAMLQKESGGDRLPGKGAKVYSLIVTEQPRKEQQHTYLEGLKKGENPVYVLNEDGWLLSPMSDLTSPDRQYKLAMSVHDPKWKQQEFTVEIYDSSSNTMLRQITASWADLPLTDNTLFSDGNRFAVVIYKVDDTVLKNVTLKFIWFPKDYFTPRERPLDYGKFLTLVGKKAE